MIPDLPPEFTKFTKLCGGPPYFEPVFGLVNLVNLVNSPPPPPETLGQCEVANCQTITSLVKFELQLRRVDPLSVWLEQFFSVTPVTLRANSAPDTRNLVLF